MNKEIITAKIYFVFIFLFLFQISCSRDYYPIDPEALHTGTFSIVSYAGSYKVGKFYFSVAPNYNVNQ